ncbi:hypothetical protein VNO78_04337 [Psophocarpus tetragonolobus]|uniref:Hydrophobic seed protein domain-containing protein n=1 Tax=Psophocarpus tetragonolobus TaxID=3891 RepID=A0AAN9T2D7_PSOTE
MKYLVWKGVALHLFFFYLVTSNSQRRPPPRVAPPSMCAPVRRPPPPPPPSRRPPLPPPPPPAPAPLPPACNPDLRICENLFVGSAAITRCCPLLAHLTDADAAACICSVAKRGELGININPQHAVDLMLKTCSRNSTTYPCNN